MKVAEAAKVIENTQCDLNISIMIELTLIFRKLGIDTLEVLQAAGTKWNFFPFRPGLVGGHCIGVGPYHLTHKAQEVGYTVVGNWQNSQYGRELKARYSNDARLIMLDPVYEANQLAVLRESCDFYLHGHSVGGTNPSLVEMLFYECKIFCLDVPFHHATAGACARYFKDAGELALLLDTPTDIDDAIRATYRATYSAEKIAIQYINAMGA